MAVHGKTKKGKHKMKKNILQACLYFCVILVFVSNLSASETCQSILLKNKKLKAHFSESTPGYRFVLDEQFANNNNKWPEIDNDQYEYSVKNRKYNIEYSGNVQFTANVDFGPYMKGNPKDVLIEVCFRFIKPTKWFWNTDKSKPAEFGLCWDFSYYNDKPNRKFKFFYINNTGQWTYGYRSKPSKGGWRSDWKSDSAIKKGDDLNILSVRIKGETAFLYINGKEVDTIGTGRSSRIGFCSETSSYRKNKNRENKGIVEVEWLTVRETQPTIEALKTLLELYKEIKNGERSNSTISYGGWVFDLRTNLMWRKNGMRGSLSSSFDRDRYSACEKWIKKLNLKHDRGFNDLRIPTIAEYSTIFKKGEGIGFSDKNKFGLWDNYTLGYMKGINGRGPWAWSSDITEDKNHVYVYNFINPRKVKKEKYPKDGHKYLELIPVRTVSMDIVSLINSAENTKQLSKKQKQIFERVIAAYKSGLDDSGEMLFDALLNQAAHFLFANNYTRVIAEKKLPLKLASKLLLAVYDKEKNNPVFWYKYAKLAGLANQPALVLMGADKLSKVSYNGEFKEELLDQIAVFNALGYMLLGLDNKAYTALLMRFNLKDSLLVPTYLNKFATPLLKNKSKLAKVIGFDKQMLSGTYTVPKPQAFYNIETGKLVKPVEASPEMIKADSQPKQEEKTTTKDKASGATVLD